MRALIVGATGATGKDLLNLLINDDSFHQVDIFVRRDFDFQHEKLKIHVIDFNQPETWKHLVKGDVLFSCLGTTIKAAGSKDAQWKVDYDYQYEFAKFAKENNLNNYVLVSSDSASPDSRFFYTRMKGQLEEAVKSIGFPKLSIIKPPVLIRKNSDRTMETFGLKAIQLINRVGMLSSHQPLPTEILAKAMINSAKRKENGVLTLDRKSIWKYAETNMDTN